MGDRVVSDGTAALRPATLGLAQRLHEGVSRTPSTGWTRTCNRHYGAGGGIARTCRQLT